MCGIAGAYAPGSAGLDLHDGTRRMLRSLHHRGPDHEGLLATTSSGDGAAVIGNTRLSILDPSPAGHQPIVDADTESWIVHNGEVYNHLELRALLPGAPWRSGSDAETVLRAYLRWGPACLDRMRGMFAFAVWDGRERALFCARDRLGIKPLYLYQRADRLLFASEVRALLASGLVPRKLDRNALAGYVRFGAVPEPSTLVRGVESLPAGCWARARAGRTLEVRPYWSPPAPRRRTLRSRQDADARVERLLQRSVGEHLLSDVPVALFLSGGLDSSLIAAFASRATSRPLVGFTVGSPERALDESAIAAQVASRCGLEHRRVVFGERELGPLVEAAVAAMDQPTMDGLNTYLVSRAVHEAGFKVALSGLGGDELFGGYPSFRVVPWARRSRRLLSRVPARVLSALVRGGAGDRVAAMTRRSASTLAAYEHARALWGPERLIRMGLDPHAGLGGQEPPAGSPLEVAVSRLELSGYMRSVLLRDADVMSMAHSLELRVPLLDHELVEACLEEGLAREVVAPWRALKPMLRRIALRTLPGVPLGRPKQGFHLPMERWLRGPLRAQLTDGLEALERSGALPGVEVDALLGEFQRGRIGWARVWSLAVLGAWIAAHLGTTAGADR